MKNKPEGYEWPHVYDLHITVISALILTIVKRVCEIIFYPFLVKICKEQYDLYVQELRTKKMAASLYKTLYFISSTIWGYSVLKNQPWFPTYLGGTGDIVDTFKGYPYQGRDDKVKVYVLVT